MAIAKRTWESRVNAFLNKSQRLWLAASIGPHRSSSKESKQRLQLSLWNEIFWNNQTRTGFKHFGKFLKKKNIFFMQIQINFLLFSDHWNFISFTSLIISTEFHSIVLFVRCNTPISVLFLSRDCATH